MDVPKKADINYSLKNIPYPSRDAYLKKLIVQVEKVLQCIRWKVHFFLNPLDKDPPNRHGFRTPHNAKQSQELISFEADVTHLIANIEYRENKAKPGFQKLLKKDVKYINNSKNIFIKADKTNNIYEVSKATYVKYMNDNVTAHYEKAPQGTERDINVEARGITERLKISDRVEPIAHKEAYVTLKDHKKGFPNDPKCRLINPAKTNIGLLSKKILQKVNSNIRLICKLKQWRSTNETLEWYNALPNKTRHVFLQLDIVDFYPSISKTLFIEAIEFAKTITNINPEEERILKNSRKSLLFFDNSAWKKKKKTPDADDAADADATADADDDDDGLHDVTMGSYDGCEVCELVGLLILRRMSERFPELNFGLYRDDGLGVHRRLPGPRLDRMRKDIEALFKNLGLKITIETKLTVVDFLDVTLNLHDETHAPYRKPNDEPLYINVNSNHPKSVIKQVPMSVESRLNAISSNKDIFDKAKPAYEKALRDSGHKGTLEFKAKQSSKKRKRKRRDEIHFNPPFNKEVKTDIGRQFLRLIDKNFPSNNPISKVINRKTVKLSYTCTDNMAKVISKHNKKVLADKPEAPNRDKTCNCKVPANCPVDGKCRTQSVIYKATLKSADASEYIGLTDTPFKTRYDNHTFSFRHETKSNATTLAAHVWKLGLNPNPDIKWEIIQECPKYTVGQYACQLCLCEKLHILKNMNSPKSLNKRADIGNKCVLHKKKHFLNSVT